MINNSDPLWQNGQIPATHRRSQPDVMPETPAEQARRQNSQSAKKSKKK